MSAPAIKPLGNAAELEQLLREQLQRHGLRLKPGCTLPELIALAEQQGLKLDVAHHTLIGDVQGSAANLPACIERIAETNADKFWPRTVGNVAARDQMDQTAKIQYIREHGLQAFESLPARSTDVAPTDLDPGKVTADQYKRLPAAVKASCVQQWGIGTISQIMRRK